MKRVILFAAIFLFSSGLYAQMEPAPEPAPAPAPAPEEPKPAPAPEAKPDAKPARPGRVRPAAEAPKVDKAVLEEEFKALDRDDDGKLTKEELGDTRAAMLDKDDADKDGTISKDEWVKAREAAAKAKPAEGRPGAGMQRDYIKDLDKDGDGKISKEEAPERVKAKFEELDADKDGFLTREELGAGMKAAGKGQKGRPGKDGEAKPAPEAPKETPAEPPKEAPKEEGSK